MSIADVAIAFAVGLAAGALSGLLGVGGGFVMVPAMVFLLGLDQHVAQGTSLLVIVPTALAGTIANLKRAHTDRRVALVLGVGGVAGSVIGALVSVQLDEALLRKIFGVFLLVVSGRMLLHGRRQDPAPSP